MRICNNRIKKSLKQAVHNLFLPACFFCIAAANALDFKCLRGGWGGKNGSLAGFGPPKTIEKPPFSRYNWGFGTPGGGGGGTRGGYFGPLRGRGYAWTLEEIEPEKYIV